MDCVLGDKRTCCSCPLIGIHAIAISSTADVNNSDPNGKALLNINGRVGAERNTIHGSYMHQYMHHQHLNTPLNKPVAGPKLNYKVNQFTKLMLC